MFMTVPFEVQQPGGEYINPSLFRPVIKPGREAGADGHWRLKGSSASLTDLNGNALTVLTPADGAHLPTYDSVSATIAEGGRYGLKTPWDDQAVHTWWAVTDRPVIASGQLYVIGGTFRSGVTVGGGLVWASAGTIQLLGGFGGAMQNDTMTPPATLLAGDVFFCAWSQSASARIGFISNGDDAVTFTHSNAYAQSAFKIALGNTETLVANYLHSIRAYEFGVFQGVGKTIAEMKLIMQRSRLRLADDGIVVK
jgi:hypothetical protein